MEAPLEGAELAKVSAVIDRAITRRNRARAKKQFKIADELRDMSFSLPSVSKTTKNVFLPAIANRSKKMCFLPRRCIVRVVLLFTSQLETLSRETVSFASVLASADLSVCRAKSRASIKTRCERHALVCR